MTEQEKKFDDLINATKLGKEFTENVDFLFELFERTMNRGNQPATLSKDHLISIYQAAATLLNAQIANEKQYF